MQTFSLVFWVILLFTSSFLIMYRKGWRGVADDPVVVAENSLALHPVLTKYRGNPLCSEWLVRFISRFEMFFSRRFGLFGAFIVLWIILAGWGEG